MAAWLAGWARARYEIARAALAEACFSSSERSARRSARAAAAFGARSRDASSTSETFPTPSVSITPMTNDTSSPAIATTFCGLSSASAASAPAACSCARMLLSPITAARGAMPPASATLIWFA